MKNYQEIVDIPVIIFSKDNHTESLIEARSLMVVDYWVKDFDDNDNIKLDRMQLIEKINFV